MNTPLWLADIQYVLWDLDGTLYPHSLELEREIERRLVHRVAEHLQTDYDTASLRFTNLRHEIKSNTTTLDRLGIPGTEFFTQMWDELDWSQYIAPNPELVKVLRASHLPNGILTNSNEPRQVQRKLQTVGFDSSDFDPIVTSTQTGFPKPDPRAFLAALSVIGLPPEHVLYVGDRLEVDILGALNVGMRAVLVGSRDDRAPWSVDSAVMVLRTLSAGNA